MGRGNIPLPASLTDILVGFSFQIRPESMGACFLTPCSQNSQTMQSSMVRMAGSWHSQDRVVKGGRREIAPSGKVDADTVEDYRSNCGKNSYPVLGKVSKVTR